MTFSLAGGVNDDLVINVNFLRGTLASSTAFESIIPTTVTDKTFEHIGFNLSKGSLYDAFGTYNPSSRPFTATGESGNIDQRDFIIQSMKNYLGRTVSFYFHWGDIAQDPSGSTLLVNGSFNPATLTPGPGGPLEQKIAEIYANGKWQKSTDILTSLHNNEFDVVATVGTGGTIKDGTGSGTMAPDRSIRGISGNNFYVDKNTYLYYLKIFAHAVVRKYKDQIGVWLVQPELNAAKFASWIGWKYGNCWDEQGNTNDKFQWQVWRTWVDAVRQEDPTAKVSTAFHMLNMQYGLETFGPDCDIISVNVYPNEMFATPVMGFAVGELVWGVRRALKGMGWEHKPVWITETNYPGVIDNNAEEPPIGTTLENNLTWYSYGRQAKYMRDAIESAAENGAKGFFWWHFLDSDSGYDPFPWTGYGSLIVGNSNTPLFKVPAVTAFQSKSSAKHFGKSNVTLTNKSTSNSNLGGVIGIYAERDNLSSGASIYINKNRSHVSQTYNPVISSQRHQSWGMPTALAAQFRLKEDFIPTDQIISRNAWFATTSPVTFNTSCIDGGTVSASTLNHLDPWWVDGNGNQPNNPRAVSLSPSFSDNVFLDQTIDPQNPSKPYYQLNALTTQTITLNGQPALGVFHNWSYSNATAQDAYSATSGFVFNTGATVTANYKAHLASNSTAALSSNGQRKILRDIIGVYHAVYESAGKIFYTSSTDGTNWTNEVYLSREIDAHGLTSRNPTIDLYYDISVQTWYPVVAWESRLPDNSGYELAARRVYGTTWAPQEYITGGNSIIMGNNGTPVLAYPYVISRGSDGLYVTRCLDVDAYGAGRWYSDLTKIPGTTSSSQNPSALYDPWKGTYLLHLAWDDNSSLYYRNMTYSSGYQWSSTDTVSYGVEEISNTSPTIGMDNAGYIWIAWKYLHTEVINSNRIKARKRLGTNSYGTVSSFGSGSGNPIFHSPSISGNRQKPGNNDLSIAWHKSTNEVQKVSYVNGAWGSISTLSSSNQTPQLVFNETAVPFTNKIGFSRSTSGSVYALTPIAFAEGGGMQKITTTEPAQQYSRGVIVHFDSVSYSIEFGNIILGKHLGETQTIPLKNLPDTITINVLEDVNLYLCSNPFVAYERSEISLDLKAYPIEGKNIPLNGKDVAFRLEFVDYKRGTSLYTMFISHLSEKRKEIEVLPYQFGNTGDKEVFVRLSVVPRGDQQPKFTLVNVYNYDELGLNKTGDNHTGKRIDLIPKEFFLGQNFPNPFNPVTTIHYELPKNEYVTLKIFDAVGREAATLVDGMKEAGVYEAHFDASKLSSGLYFYTIKAGKFSATKKMLVVK